MAAWAANEANSAAAMNQWRMTSPWGGPILNSDRRPLLPDLGRLFEGVRELQHAEVVAVAPDDLQANRQSVGREARRHRDRRQAGDADVVAALHPVDVVLELHARDLGRVLHV